MTTNNLHSELEHCPPILLYWYQVNVSNGFWDKTKFWRNVALRENPEKQDI